MNSEVEVQLNRGLAIIRLLFFKHAHPNGIEVLGVHEASALGFSSDHNFSWSDEVVSLMVSGVRLFGTECLFNWMSVGNLSFNVGIPERSHLRCRINTEPFINSFLIPEGHGWFIVEFLWVVYVEVANNLQIVMEKVFVVVFDVLSILEPHHIIKSWQVNVLEHVSSDVVEVINR